MQLHIGDRILEVNGEPVAEQPLEKVENLLRYSNQVLQVSSPSNDVCFSAYDCFIVTADY